jgi:hypothetical protein
VRCTHCYTQVCCAAHTDTRTSATSLSASTAPARPLPCGARRASHSTNCAHTLASTVSSTLAVSLRAHTHTAATSTRHTTKQAYHLGHNFSDFAAARNCCDRAVRSCYVAHMHSFTQRSRARTHRLSARVRSVRRLLAAHHVGVECIAITGTVSVYTSTRHTHAVLSNSSLRASSSRARVSKSRPWRNADTHTRIIRTHARNTKRPHLMSPCLRSLPNARHRCRCHRRSRCHCCHCRRAARRRRRRIVRTAPARNGQGCTVTVVRNPSSRNSQSRAHLVSECSRCGSRCAAGSARYEKRFDLLRHRCFQLQHKQKITTRRHNYTARNRTRCALRSALNVFKSTPGDLCTSYIASQGEKHPPLDCQARTKIM